MGSIISVVGKTTIGMMEPFFDTYIDLVIPI